MIKQEEVFKIGRIGKPHGVKGEVTFQFDDDVFDRVDCDYLVLSVDGILVPFFFDEYRFHGQETALVKFCDIDSQERAAELTGCDVYFPRKLADDSGDDLSWAEIVGYNIKDANAEGLTVGTVAAVDDTTINTLFELEDGTLIPATDELIDDIDRTSRTITMRLPEGLIEKK